MSHFDFYRLRQKLRQFGPIVTPGTSMMPKKRRHVKFRHLSQSFAETRKYYEKRSEKIRIVNCDYNEAETRPEK